MFERRRAFITGAASGLARGIAIDLARHGYRVAFTYRPGGTGPEQTLARIRDAGGAEGVAVAADHARVGDTERSVRAAAQALGGIDAYVHAVGPIVVKLFASSTQEDARAMLAGNFESAVEGAFAALPAMRAQGYGRLVFFGMNGSGQTLPARGMSLYGAAKAAVVTFARSLALEEAKAGITVNAIEPGDIRNKDLDRAGSREVSANNPTGHAGSWEDVAYAVRFLVSQEASFINGMTLGVNGGLVESHE
ncbi:MAG: SDR family oxidoreductase [Candidatus Eremiobacteraeota bacterium]|nr:SDR family oxidoreductase [Candidatus Eremiobacteraeota bacterium]